MTAIPLRLLFYDGEEGHIDQIAAKKSARELKKNELRPPYPLPVWQVDPECYLVLHYGKSYLAGLRYLASSGEIRDDHPVEVQIFAGTLDEAQRAAVIPAAHRRTAKQRRGIGRRPSPEALRIMLENLPIPASRNGYQAGIVHALTYVVRGIEPTSQDWIDYTRAALRTPRRNKL